MPEKIDKDFLRKFRTLILNFVKKNNRVVIVCGGGGVCRDYQTATKDIYKKSSAIDIDWVGIAATKLNAELVRVIFGNLAYEKVIDDPKRKIKTAKKIIIGSGFVPGSSSDLDAVYLAKNFNAHSVINLSNIDYVYDKNPAKYKDAKPQPELSWKEFFQIVGRKWVPGGHYPFDPVASKLAQKLKINVVVANGKDLSNLSSYLAGRKFKGTVIK